MSEIDAYRIQQIVDNGNAVQISLIEDVQTEPLSQKQLIVENVAKKLDEDTKKQVMPLLEAILQAQPTIRVKSYAQTNISITMPKNRYEKMGKPQVGDKLEVDLKSAGRASLMRKSNNDHLVLHLLYASPITRGEIEVIEDIVPLYDIRVSLRMDESPNRVTYVPENKSIEFKYELGRLNFVVDKLEMHSMIEIS